MTLTDGAWSGISRFKLDSAPFGTVTVQSLAVGHHCVGTGSI